MSCRLAQVRSLPKENLRIDDLTTLRQIHWEYRVRHIIETYASEHQIQQLNEKDPAPADLVTAIESVLAQETDTLRLVWLPARSVKNAST